MSSIFSSSGPGAGKITFKAANPLAPKPAPKPLPAPKPAPVPMKTVHVRAHTRSIPVKRVPKAPVATPDAAVKTPAQQPAGRSLAPVETVRPGESSTVQRLRPHFQGEPVAGITQGHWNPDGTF